MKTQKLIGVFTIGIIVVTTFQAYLPQLSLSDATEAVVSAIAMYLATAMTVWKQHLSEEIDNKSKWPTLIVATIATLGGLTQLIPQLATYCHISDSAQQWCRFAITFITMTLNLISKIVWPTPQTKSLI